jgi:hypothetical protein
MWPNVIHLTSRSVYPYGDAVQMIWANGWVAHAISNFDNPFFSPNLMAPHGTNLLALPCAVGLALVFTPVTWLLGAVASFNLQLIVMPVISGAAFYFASQPFFATRRARWLGGLLWGFSPFVLASLNIGWTNVGYQFFIPLAIALVADELYVRKRSSLRNGIYLGLLVAAQITVGSEVVASTAIVMAMLATGALMVHVVRHRNVHDFVPTTWRKFVGGLAVPTIFLTLPLSLYSVFGPSHLHDWVWEESKIRSNHLWSLGAFVDSPLAALNPFLPPMAASPTFFGWTLLVALSGCAWYARGRIVARVGVVIAALGVWLSFGEGLSPSIWKVVYQLPVVHNILAIRLEVWPWFGAALVLASAIDRYVVEHRSRPSARWLPRLTAAALVVWGAVSFHAVIPVNSVKIQSFPAVSELGRTQPGINIMTWPSQESVLLMIQQTRDGFTTTTPGTFGAAIRILSPEERRVSYALFKSSRFAMLDDLLKSKKGRQRIRHQIAAWNVRAIVVPITIPEPLAAFAPPSAFQVQMTRLYGVPEIRNGSFVWDPVTSSPPRRMPSPLRILFCLSRAEQHPSRLPGCLVGENDG